MTYQETTYQKVHIADATGNIITSFSNSSSPSVDTGSGATTSTTTRVVAATDSPEVVGIGQVRDRLPATLGAKSSTNSTSVVLATDQATIPVQDTRLPTSLGQTTAANALPVTLATDGVFAQAFGTTADTTATSDSATASYISLFKRLLAKIPVIGQTVKSGSISVAIASDQIVSVSATSLPLPTNAATDNNLNNIIGNQSDGAASTDTATTSLIGLFKRLLSIYLLAISTNISTISTTLTNSIANRLMPSGTTFKNTGLAISSVVKSSAGSLYYLISNNNTSSVRYIQIINATSVPSSGYALTNNDSYLTVGANGITLVGQDIWGGGLSFATGIVIVVSTTALTYTPATIGDVSWEGRYA